MKWLIALPSIIICISSMAQAGPSKPMADSTQKAALRADFEANEDRSLANGFVFSFWLHGGEPGSDSKCLGIVCDANRCRGTYLTATLDAQLRQRYPSARRKISATLDRDQVKALLRKIFASGLYEKTYPSESAHGVADLLEETWEVEHESTTLKTTFFGTFPAELNAVRDCCRLIIEKIEKTGQLVPAISKEEALQIASVEGTKHGLVSSDYAMTTEPDSINKDHWTIWFDKKDSFPLPGGKHSVRVDKKSGEAIFMQGE